MIHKGAYLSYFAFNLAGTGCAAERHLLTWSQPGQILLRNPSTDLEAVLAHHLEQIFVGHGDIADVSQTFYYQPVRRGSDDSLSQLRLEVLDSRFALGNLCPGHVDIFTHAALLRQLEALLRLIKSELGGRKTLLGVSQICLVGLLQG